MTAYILVYSRASTVFYLSEMFQEKYSHMERTFVSRFSVMLSQVMGGYQSQNP